MPACRIREHGEARTVLAPVYDSFSEGFAIELNIRGNEDHVKVANIFETLLSGIRPRGAPKPDR
jgi:hypothetical protein